MIPAWTPCFLVLIPWISATVGGHRPFAQSFQEPKYKIEFHPIDSPHPTTPDQEVVPMTDKDGRKYMCALTDLLPQSDKNEGGPEKDSSTGLATRKTPEELLSSLKDTCTRTKADGWWTYEVCFDSEIRQIHPSLKVTQEFTLGSYDEEATAALHRDKALSFLQKDVRSQGSAQRYHVRLYTNGTRCDLTNEPRETEVRFVCSLESREVVLHSIKEAPSCKYTIIVQYYKLCDHPLFHEEQPPCVWIHCNEIAYGDVAPEMDNEEKISRSTSIFLSDEAGMTEVVATS